MVDNPVDLLKSCFSRYKNVKISITYRGDNSVSKTAPNMSPTYIYSDPIMGREDNGGVWICVSHDVCSNNFICLNVLAKQISQPLRANLHEMVLEDNRVKYSFYTDAKYFQDLIMDTYRNTFEQHFIEELENELSK